MSSQPSTASLIPTYASDGRRLRNYSEAGIERLLSLNLIVVERKGRHGRIVSAHFRSISGANPLRNTAHMGQSYSHIARVGPTARCWQHTPLLQRPSKLRFAEERETPEEIAAAESFVRNVFRNVAASCIVETPAAVEPVAAPCASVAPTRAKVVSIEFGRKPKASSQPARPIEFDSERRAA